MNTNETIKILASLANRIDPFTEERVPTQSVVHHPKVIRALFTALQLLSEHDSLKSNHPPRTINRKRAPPPRAGLPWSDEEDQQLRHFFHQGMSFQKIASQHCRNKGAILSRLARLGEITPHKTESSSENCDSGNKKSNEKWWKKERPQAGKKWTTQEDEMLKGLYSSSSDIDKIAKQLGRGTFAVEVRLHKLGIWTE